MLQNINKMDKFFFKEIKWRPFNPLGYHKLSMKKVGTYMNVAHIPNLFENALNSTIITGTSLQKVWKTFFAFISYYSIEEEGGDYSKEVKTLRSRLIENVKELNYK